jgi:hypothetical protein
MIVLDTVNTSLNLVAAGVTNLTVVVSYWSIDNTSGLWTPKSNSVTITSLGSTPILAAPASGFSKVVENIWINNPGSSLGPGQNFAVTLNDGTGPRTIAKAGGNNSVSYPMDTVLTIKRDGSVTRQYVEYAMPPNATLNQNVV